MAFEQVFKQIDDKLRVDEGCATALDYVEQSSWILFLKYLDDLDQTREQSALLTGEPFTPIIDQEYRWSTWAMPKNAKGEYDIQNALVGDDLIEFVNLKLFPYLAKFLQTAQDGTVEKKIGVIFKEVKNKIASGYNLREVIELVDSLRFQTSEEKHEMSALYENRNTDNASVALRKKLLEDCNLHTVLDLPSGVFQGAGVKTVVLFFKKGAPTQKVWYYQLNLDRTLGKTNPLNEKDLAEFLELQKNPKETENSWFLDVNSLDENYDLSAKNPNKVEVVDERTPEEIMAVIEDLAKERTSLFNELKGLV